MSNDGPRAPGFFRICGTDAYLLKMCCIFLPLLLIVLIYDAASGRPLADCLLPGLLSAGLLGAILYRWSAISGTFQDHETIPARILDISPPSGLFGLQVHVSFSSNDGAVERGCFLVRFNQRVRELRKGSQVTILWNRKNTYIIYQAYCH